MRNNLNNNNLIIFIKNEAILFLLFIGLVLVLKSFGTIIAFSYLIYKTIFSNKSWVVKSLIYGYFVRSLNSFIFIQDSSILLIFGWLLLLTAFIKIFFTNRNPDKMIFFIIIFSLYALIVVILKSPLIVLSLFKLVSFVIGFLTVYIGLKVTREYDWESFFFTLWIIIIIVSLFLYPFHLNLEAKLFQGVFSHPQTFGVVCAVFGSFFTLSWYKIRLNRYMVFFILILNFIFLFLSRSRTGMLAFLIAIIIVSLTRFIRGLKNKTILNKGFSFKKIVLSILLLITFMGTLPLIIEEAKHFIVKDVVRSGVIEVSGENIMFSRFELLAKSFDNISNNIWIGIGFGSPTIVEYLFVRYLPGTSIPISATMEKGNIVTMVLEEMGLVGLVLLTGLWLILGIKIYNKNILYLPLLLTVILTNMGEASFFSSSADGLFMWVCMFLAYMRAAGIRNTGNYVVQQNI